MKMRTPLKSALGLGSAKAGRHHFVVQRVTAVALVLLGAWVAWTVLRLLQLDHVGAHALVAEPANAVLMVAFVVATFWHAQLGLQVVLEDYVHDHGMQLLLQLAVRFLCFLGAAAGVLAVIRIALGH
jgi:succinate dehydrogenase / fumarate reductase membrane anchor subunit